MVLELNASDERGIDVVRDQIKTFASTKQIFSSGFKLIILDEADAMTSQAQNALRRIIEKYTAHTRFCILANYTHKIAPALLSRCTRFRFSPLSTDAVRSRLDYVIEKESVNLSPEAHDALLDLCGGDMRRALNVLQACKAAVDHGDRISEEMVYDCVGSPRPGDVKAILNAILNQDWPTALDSINVIKQAKGLALADILSSITLQLKDLQLKNVTMASLLDGLSEVEWRLSTGGNEVIQTSACIGVIKSSIELEAK
jgi:replication factor C subunit 3/5